MVPFCGSPDVDIITFFGLLFAAYKQARVVSVAGIPPVCFLPVVGEHEIWKGVTMTRLSRSSKFWLLERALLVVISLTIVGVSAAQTMQKTPNAKGDEPIFLDYRGVKIGWLADEVRKKLGDPANKGDEQDFYVLNEKETCQIFYDKATKKVTAISVDFMNGAREVITPQQVFGEDIQAKADGSKSRLVRYPKAGFWVSYNRTAGETPMVTVTIQQMPPQ
ncbi:MAG TPA: hypothetical protein VFB70_07945 [Pyrinomonadaceae bacterium]|nr:hypothetical protein [Pyrinomonadaceae bacterium]